MCILRNHSQTVHNDATISESTTCQPTFETQNKNSTDTQANEYNCAATDAIIRTHVCDFCSAVPGRSFMVQEHTCTHVPTHTRIEPTADKSGIPLIGFFFASGHFGWVLSCEISVGNTCLHHSAESACLSIGVNHRDGHWRPRWASVCVH